MSSERLDAPATSKNSKPDFIIGEYLFVLLACVAFVILWLVSKFHTNSTKNLDIVDGIAIGGLILFLRKVFSFCSIYISTVGSDGTTPVCASV